MYLLQNHDVQHITIINLEFVNCQDPAITLQNVNTFKHTYILNIYFSTLTQLTPLGVDTISSKKDSANSVNIRQ